MLFLLSRFRDHGAASCPPQRLGQDIVPFQTSTLIGAEVGINHMSADQARRRTQTPTDLRYEPKAEVKSGCWLRHDGPQSVEPCHPNIATVRFDLALSGERVVLDRNRVINSWPERCRLFHRCRATEIVSRFCIYPIM
jgi:hypothetical protein